MSPRKPVHYAVLAVLAVGTAAFLSLSSCDGASTGSGGNGSGNGNGNGSQTSIAVDQDAKIDVPAGQASTYTFVASPLSTYQVSFTPGSSYTLEVTDSLGKSLGKSTSASSAVIFSNSGTRASTYTITVKNTGTGSGATVLRVTQISGPDRYEPDDTRAQATLIPTDSTVQSHSLSIGEDDWYKFDVKAGKVYRVSISSSFTGESNLYPDSTSSSSSMTTLNAYSIKATQSGRMFLDFSGSAATSSGAYKIAISVDTAGIDKYEPDDSRVQATLITTDSAVQSHYLQAGEHDWLKFDVQAGKMYDVAISGAFTGKSSLYLDSASSSPSSTTSSAYSIKAPQSGRMFLDFSGSAATSSGAYKIAISVDTAGIDKYEPDDSRAQATLITTDSVAQSHYLQAGEHDWLKFKADSGKAYKIAIGGFNGGIFYVYRDSASATYMDLAYTFGTFKASKSGTMLIDLAGKTSTSSGAYTVAVSVDLTGTDKYEPDNTLAQASWITTDSVAQSHYLQTDEHDWVKFNADSGKLYKITIGKFTNGQYCVYSDSTASRCALNSSSPSGSIKALKTGPMFVDFRGALSSYSGAYTIAVSVDSTSEDKYEPDGTRALAGRIATDGTWQNHYLQAGEDDWVKFSVDSGMKYVLTTTGTASTALHLYGDSTTSSYDSGTSSVSMRARSAGTFFCLISGNNSLSAGPYSVSVASAPIPVGEDDYEPDNSMSAARSIWVGIAQSHHLQPGEHDWVKFTGTAGKTYQIHVVTPKGDANVDYDVYDAASNSITQGGSDGMDAAVSVNTSGTFYVDLSGFNSNVDTDYTIKVSVQQ